MQFRPWFVDRILDARRRRIGIIGCWTFILLFDALVGLVVLRTRASLTFAAVATIPLTVMVPCVLGIQKATTRKILARYGLCADGTIGPGTPPRAAAFGFGLPFLLLMQVPNLLLHHPVDSARHVVSGAIFGPGCRHPSAPHAEAITAQMVPGTSFVGTVEVAAGADRYIVAMGNATPVLLPGVVPVPSYEAVVFTFPGGSGPMLVTGGGLVLQPANGRIIVVGGSTDGFYGDPVAIATACSRRRVDDPAWTLHRRDLTAAPGLRLTTKSGTRTITATPLACLADARPSVGAFTVDGDLGDADITNVSVTNGVASASNQGGGQGHGVGQVRDGVIIVDITAGPVHLEGSVPCPPR